MINKLLNDGFGYVLEPFLQEEMNHILFVQEVFSTPFHEKVFSFISIITAPKFLQIFVIPLIAAFEGGLFTEVLYISVAVEIFSSIGKWFLGEDRPYWFFSATEKKGQFNYMRLRQTELTCATSAGSPSNHIMVAAAVLFILSTKLETHLVRRYDKWKSGIQFVIRFNYYFLLFLITTSQMYLGTHFMHQCMISIIISLSLVKYIEMKNFVRYVLNMHRMDKYLLTISLIGVIIACYWLLKLIGINPQWTVHKAFESCAFPYKIKPESTQIYHLVSSIGQVLAIASVKSRKQKITTATTKQSKNGKRKMRYYFSIPLTLLIIYAHYMAYFFAPVDTGYIFYFCYTVTINMIVTILLMQVPRLCEDSNSAGSNNSNSSKKSKNE